MSKKGKYTIKKIVKNCIFPEGLYELKDKETKFYLILEDKANVEKLEDYLIDKDRKIADLLSQLDQANEDNVWLNAEIDTLKSEKENLMRTLEEAQELRGGE